MTTAILIHKQKITASAFSSTSKIIMSTNKLTRKKHYYIPNKREHTNKVDLVQTKKSSTICTEENAIECHFTLLASRQNSVGGWKKNVITTTACALCVLDNVMLCSQLFLFIIPSNDQPQFCHFESTTTHNIV